MDYTAKTRSLQSLVKDMNKGTINLSLQDLLNSVSTQFMAFPFERALFSAPIRVLLIY